MIAFDRYSGNFASSIPEQDAKATLVAAIPRTVGFRSPTTPQCPVSQPRHRGGLTSGALLANQIHAAAICDLQRTLAVKKQAMVPGCAIDPATRFVQYQRLPNPAPCPVSVINPAIPAAIMGPCTNVVGICTTWPPS